MSKGFNRWIVYAVIILTAYIGIYLLSITGVNIHNEKDIKEINSIEEINLNTEFLKELIGELDSNYKIVLYNTIYTIYNKDYILKTCKLVNKNLDLLSFDKESNYDKIINGIRVRKGYKEYPNTTIYNWSDNYNNYSLMINNTIDTKIINSVLGILAE